VVGDGGEGKVESDGAEDDLAYREARPMRCDATVSLTMHLLGVVWWYDRSVSVMATDEHVTRHV